MSWTFPRPAFPEEEYYEEGDVPEGSDVAYNYQEENYTEAEYADEGYGYTSQGIEILKFFTLWFTQINQKYVNYAYCITYLDFGF